MQYSVTEQIISFYTHYEIYVSEYVYYKCLVLKC